jgi:hypothetical protein
VVGDHNLSSNYWLVRKVVAGMAYFGGLRSIELLNLQIQDLTNTPEGIYVDLFRAKQRDTEESSRYLFPTLCVTFKSVSPDWSLLESIWLQF